MRFFKNEWGFFQHASSPKGHSSQAENTKLKQTIDEYRAEFAEIKNQDATILRLKERIRQARTA